MIRSLLLAGVALAMCMAGCDRNKNGGDEGVGGDEGLGSARVAVFTSALTEEIARVQVTVTGEYIDPDIVAELVLDGDTGEWQGTIEGIPAGDNRTFTAEAYSDTDELLYSGSVSGITITDGETVSVTILLQQSTPPDPFANSVPFFTAFVASLTEVAPGHTVTLTAEADDPDPADALTFAWSATGGTFSEPAVNGPSISQPGDLETPRDTTLWTAPAEEGAYQITVSVSDPHLATATLTATIDVRIHYGSGDADITVELNTWPVVQNILPSPTRVDVGESSLVDLTAEDEDGDALSYSWSVECDGSFDDSTLEDPTFTLDADNGDQPCTLTVEVDDGRGGSTSGQITLQTGPGLSIDACIPTDEVCDGVDNDCDGEIDEGGVCGPVCGNGEVEEGELCDGDTLPCVDVSPDWASGTAVCDDTCGAWDTTGCEAAPNPDLASFPDADFEACVRAAVGIPEGELYKSDLRFVAELSCTYRGIESIQGVQYFENLESLIVYGNNISDISMLSGLAYLEVASLSFNEITDISALAALSNLQEVYLSLNDGFSDISPLSGLPNLHTIRAYGNPLIDLGAFASGFAALESLDLNQCQIFDITALGNLPALVDLNLSRNNISDTTPIHDMLQMESLNFGFNYLSDIEFVLDMTSLTYLYLYGNCIADTSPATYMETTYGTQININGQDSVCEPPTPPVCGNDVVEVTEICDNTTIACTDIDPVSYISGTASCDMDTCKAWDQSACVLREQVCGDGVIQGDELCDGNSLYCGDFDPQYNAGSTVCNDTCSGWDLSNCVVGTNPPGIDSVSPPNGAVDVALDTTVTVYFDREMDPQTICSLLVDISALSVDGVPGYVDCPGLGYQYSGSITVAVFHPYGLLDYDTAYTARVSAFAMDVDGNALGQEFVWSFTTLSDTVAPSVVSVFPIDGQLMVSTLTSVTVEFDEPMDDAGIEGGEFTVDGVAGEATCNQGCTEATFVPDAPLDHDTLYEVRVTPAAEDSQGVPMGEAFTSTFRTQGEAEKLSGDVPPVVSYPELIYAANGDGMAVWDTSSESWSGLHTLMYALYDAGTDSWSADAALDTGSSNGSISPSLYTVEDMFMVKWYKGGEAAVAVYQGGAWSAPQMFGYAVGGWSYFTTGTTFAAASRDALKLWNGSTFETLDTNPDNDYRSGPPKYAVNGDAVAYVISDSGAIRTNVYDGASWDGEAEIDYQATGINAKWVVPYGSGFLAVWSAGRKVLASRYSAGAWQTPVIVHEEPSLDIIYMELLTDGSDAMAHWRVSDGGDLHDEWAAHFDGSWSTALVASSVDAFKEFMASDQGYALVYQYGSNDIEVRVFSGGAWNAEHAFTGSTYWFEAKAGAMGGYIIRNERKVATYLSGAWTELHQVHPDFDLNQFNVALAGRPDGRFGVLFGVGYDLYAAGQIAGTTWSAAVDVFDNSPYSGAASDPAIAVNSQGQAMVAWRQESGDPDQKGVWASYLSGGAWSAPVHIANLLSAPEVACSDQGCIVLYRHGATYTDQPYVRYFSFATESWSAQQIIYTTTDPGDDVLATNGDGFLYSIQVGDLIEIYASTNGTTWSHVRDLGVEGYEYGDLQIVSADGNYLLVYFGQDRDQLNFPFIRALIYDGVAFGDETILGSNYRPRGFQAVARADGQFAVSWVRGIVHISNNNNIEYYTDYAIYDGSAWQDTEEFTLLEVPADPDWELYDLAQDGDKFVHLYDELAIEYDTVGLFNLPVADMYPFYPNASKGDGIVFLMGDRSAFYQDGLYGGDTGSLVDLPGATGANSVITNNDAMFYGAFELFPLDGSREIWAVSGL